MATKTFKIGECCKGGVITAVTTAKSVTIIAKEWDMSQGTKKGSNQSNAKEFNRLEVEIGTTNAFMRLDAFISDLTTSYYTEQVLDWVKKNSEINSNRYWN
jgi:hypothetical protein